MTRISRAHPRYESLVTRARLADAARDGIVVPEGLIAHGRGEAFDYFLGERSTASARAAERMAAAWLLAARRPVLSVNGNVAALAAREVARLARAIPTLGVEVNLFHRTHARAKAIARALTEAGVLEVLGIRPTATIPHLPSDRARVDRRGIAAADVCLVPLEDGDRAEALRRLGKKVISIDLNPLSRTSLVADLPIIDELRRALRRIADAVPIERPRAIAGVFPPFPAGTALAEARARMAVGLTRAGRAGPRRPRARSAARPPRGTGRRSRRSR